MKSDLDRLMSERDIDALLIWPGENEDSYRTYLSNGALHSGLVVKPGGSAPVIVVNAMERDEAARSGLDVYTYDAFDYRALLRQHKGDTDRVLVEWYRRIFDHFAVRGRVAVFGVGDVNAALRTIRLLEGAFGDSIEFITETPRQTIFDRAYETKDAGELARLRDVAQRTSRVVRAVRAWLGEHGADGEVMIKADGTPLRIGEVKRHVRRLLLEHDLEDSEGMIFAQGRDAGVPHSVGHLDEPVRLGQSIVFDLFPREPGGYFHDMTRTWCLGYAPDEVRAAYDTVMTAFRRALDMCRPEVVTSRVQRMVCEYFETEGHPTVLNTPGTTEGYVHSLAHGLGLNVHEAPYFPTNGDRYTIQPGNVFTIEPGLYYPERGYGVRIEDTVAVNEAGDLEVLTDCPYDLIIELSG